MPSPQKVISTDPSPEKENDADELLVVVVKPREQKLEKMISRGVYFHGVLSHMEVADMLVNDGDFLIRQTYRHGYMDLVLSVMWHEERHHFIINISQMGYFSVSNLRFDTLQSLVWHYVTTKDDLKYTDHQQYLQLLKPIECPDWNISRKRLTIDKKGLIGRGDFGAVSSGTLLIDNKQVVVAIKTCAKSMSWKRKSELLTDATRLCKLSHPNIPKCYGLVCRSEPLRLIMHLAVHADLTRFTKFYHENCQLWNRAKQLQFSMDAAAALVYLHRDANVLHLDIAARNCLIDNRIDNPHNQILMLSDFGLSQRGPEFVLDSEAIISPRWAAPEFLVEDSRTATDKSDVWSYGVLVWEIYTDCRQQPYQQQMKDMNLEQLKITLELGHRLTFPPKTPEFIKNLCHECWKMDPVERPNMTGIQTELSRDDHTDVTVTEVDDHSDRLELDKDTL